VKVLLQRVRRASVTVATEQVARIGHGLVVLIGIERDDDEGLADYYAEKTASLRIFADDEGKMNRSLVEVGGAALVVSQFTLAAATRKGRRPSYARAALPELAEPLYRRYQEGLQSRGVSVASGVFQAMMQVELVNDGPVTILLEAPSGGGVA